MWMNSGTSSRQSSQVVPKNIYKCHETHLLAGKVLSILPANIYVKTKAAQAPKGIIHGRGTARSYDEAAAECRASVRKIAAECRRVNLKFHDKYFDIETDLKRNRRDCLHQLNESENDLDPKSVKRVAVSLLQDIPTLDAVEF